MNIIAINGSPRASQNTGTLLKKVTEDFISQIFRTPIKTFQFGVDFISEES